MSQANQPNPELRRLLDAAVPPDADRLRRTAAETGGVRPAACLQGMIETPASWETYLAVLASPATWADHYRLPPLALPETALLGCLLARDAGGLASDPQTSLPAAEMWYRSALMLEAAPTPGRDPLAGHAGLSPLRHYDAVLKVVTDTASRAGRAAAYGLALELAYESALQAAGRAGPPQVARLRRLHARLMREEVWPLLANADVEAASRVILGAWVATGDDGLLCEGLLRLLDSPRPSVAEVLAAQLGHEGTAFLLHGLHRRSSQPGTLTGRARLNLLRLVQLLTARGGGTEERRSRIEMCPSLVELLAEDMST